MRLLILIAVLLAVGCSNTEPEPAAATATPQAVVGEWLDAVAVVDDAVLGVTVEPIGLAVLAGVENELRSDGMAALLDAGLQGELSTEYWRSFRDDFRAIRGVPVDALVVGEERAEDLGPDYAAVIVSGAGADGAVILRRSAELGWQVDMIGTLGPALVQSLGDYLDSALGGAQADVIADAYESTVLPGLDAAITLDPSNADLVFGTEFIRQMLIDRAASSG